MSAKRSVLQIKRDAQTELFRIPGVRAVAVGHKYVGGKSTGQLAIIVHVEKKRVRSEIPQSQLIPASIEGIPTDVVEWKRPIDIGKLVNDTAKERPLVGGTRIVEEFEDQDPNNPILIATQNSGTLGFIGRTTGKIAGIPAGGIVGVTCQHVIADSKKQTPVGHKVGQPSTKECSSCCFCCNDIIGKVRYGVKNADVDAAIIALTKGLDYYRDIKVIGNIKAPRVLDPNTDIGAKVQKYGATTGLTKGTVNSIDHTVNIGGQVEKDGQITIDPDPATPVWDCCLCSNGVPGCGGGTDENFASFACSGDSGSAVLDMQNNIVGLLAQANCGGQGLAIGIDVVTAAMGITVETATAAKQKQTVPAVVGVNKMVGLERDAVLAPFHISSAQEEMLAQVHQELMETAIGQLCAETIHQHQQEVLQLVNHNRRVATVWHRSGGPEIVASALHLVQFHNQHLPQTVRGRPLFDALKRMQNILERYGSPELVQAMREWEPRVRDYLGFTYAELLETLKAGGAA